MEKLAAIPLQSGSSFLDLEILAKATFLGHLLSEVEIPPLARLDYVARLVDRPGDGPPPAGVPRSASR